MPKCSRCGSYFIRPPCPICSPPGVAQLIEDSPASKGKSIDELQKELGNFQQALKKLKLDYETNIMELKTQLDSINGKISDLVLSKVSSNEKKRSFDEQLPSLTDELKSLMDSDTQIEGEKNSLLMDIQDAEKRIISLNSEISSLKDQKERKQREEEERKQQREEQRLEEKPEFSNEDSESNIKEE